MEPTTLTGTDTASTEVKEGTIELPGQKELKKLFIKTTALASWSRIAEAQFTAGARTAMVAVAQVAGIAKGHDPKTTVRLLRAADLSVQVVAERLSLNMQKELKSLNDKFLKGEITEATKEDRRTKLHEKYGEANAYYATFSVDALIGDVNVCRENMNILGFTLVGKVAKGANIQLTIDEALQNVFGYSASLKDAWQSIKLGLAAQKF